MLSAHSDYQVGGDVSITGESSPVKGCFTFFVVRCFDSCLSFDLSFLRKLYEKLDKFLFPLVQDGRNELDIDDTAHRK